MESIDKSEALIVGKDLFVRITADHDSVNVGVNFHQPPYGFTSVDSTGHREVDQGGVKASSIDIFLPINPNGFVTIGYGHNLKFCRF